MGKVEFTILMTFAVIMAIFISGVMYNICVYLNNISKSFKQLVELKRNWD